MGQDTRRLIIGMLVALGLLFGWQAFMRWQWPEWYANQGKSAPPATAQVARRLAWGDVLGVGNTVRNVKPGDRVLFNPEDQLEVEIQGEGHLVMRERDIHAVATERTEHGTGRYL